MVLGENFAATVYIAMRNCKLGLVASMNVPRTLRS